jgi:hypothetical protein
MAGYTKCRIGNGSQGKYLQFIDIQLKRSQHYVDHQVLYRI